MNSYERKKMAYNLVKQNVKKLLPYQIASYLLALTAMINSMFLINLMRLLIDSFQIGDVDLSLFPSILIFAFLYLILMITYQFVFRRTQIVGHKEVTLMLYKKLQQKDISFFKKHNSGELISLINNEGKTVGDWLSQGLLALLSLSTLAILNIMLMAMYNILIACIIVFILAIFLLISRRLTTVIAKFSAESFGLTGKINQFILQTLKSVRIIFALNKHDWFFNRFSNLVHNQRYQVDKKKANFYAVYMALFLVLSVMLPILVVVLGVFLAEAQGISIGVILAFYALTANMQEPVQYIPDLLSSRKNAMALSERLLPIIENDNADEEEPDMNNLAKIKELTISSSFFSYHVDEKPLLVNLEISLKEKDVLLIKGGSGTGKSTLVELVMGFLRSDSVKISLNGLDCSAISNKTRWRNILVADQNPILFEGTINENIMLGDQYSEEELDDVIYTACLEHFSSNDNSSRMIGSDEDGVSGGQKQRISLARMLLRKPDVLIADEPTSALDNETSSRLAQRLIDFVNKNEIILIIVSHKPDFDEYATKIVELCD